MMQKRRSVARFIAIMLTALLVMTSLPIGRINAYAVETEDEIVIIDDENAEATDEDILIEDVEEASEKEEEITFVDSDKEPGEDIASGSYGNVTWRIDSNGTLYVTGTGNAYEVGSTPGWVSEDYADKIKSAVVDLKDATTLECFFKSCENLEVVDLSKLDTSKVTDMNWMFYECKSLTSVDVTKFDTSKVTDMGGMFEFCESLTALDVSGFNTSNVKNMYRTFRLCSALKELNVSGFDTGKVENMGGMFTECSSLESLDVSNFDTKNTTTLAYIFAGCEKLETIDVAGFDTQNVTDMSSMFYGCKKLKSLNLTKFDTADVTDMTSMFRECESLTSLDLSSFNTKKVKYENALVGGGGANNMFRDCKALQVLDLSSFDFTNLTKVNKDNFLKGCDSLMIIKAPTKLALEVNLPGTGWKRTDTKEEITQLPQGLEKSVVLTKGDLPKVTKLVIEPNDIKLINGDSKQLKAIPDPSYGDTSSIQWSSSDESKVKVEGSTLEATITALADGEVTITAAIGSVKATAKVTVTTPVKFDKHEITLVSKEGSKDTITATVSGEGYSADTLVWTTSDAKIATVDKGVVTAAADLTEAGKATITATTPDGKYSDSCEVNVLVAGATESPTASAEGEVEKNTRVILKSGTVDAYIYYTIDGSDPALDEKGEPQGETTLYSNPITISKACTIKAFAVCKDLKNSQVVSFTYTIKQDWGDLEADDEVKALFKDAEEIPEGLWYVIGDNYYEKGGSTAVVKSFTGAKITFNQEVKVFHNTRRLWENRDYTLSYARNQAVAKMDAGNKAPTLTIKGKGNYSKNAAFKFTIAPADLMYAELTSEKVVTVTSGSKLGTVKPVVTFKGKKLSIKKDYKLEFYKGSVSETTKVSDSTLAELGTDYVATISSGSGNSYIGALTDQITIKVVDSASKSVVTMSTAKVTIPKQDWTGFDVGVEKLFEEGKATVKVKGKTLEYGADKDYTVEKGSFVNVGKYNITIHGTARIGENVISYVGDKKGVLEITGITAKQITVDGLASSVDYIGRPYEISDLSTKSDKTVTLKYGTTNLNSLDYDVDYINNGAVGKINVVFTLKGHYTGTIKKKVTVKARKITDNAIGITGTAKYCKTGGVPERVTVKIDGMTLREGIDYKLTYKNNAKVADKNSGNKAPTVVVKGMGNYSGTASKAFTVEKSDITECVILEAADKEFKKVAGNFKVVPKLMDDGKAVKVGNGKDVEAIDKEAYTYYNARTMVPLADNEIVPIGTVIEVRAKVTCGNDSPYIKGSDYELKGKYKIIGRGYDIKKAKVKVKNPGNLSFDNGKEVLPLLEKDLEVRLGGKTLKSEEYEIVSVKNNNFLGTATAVIRGRGSYGGTKKFTFIIGARALN